MFVDQNKENAILYVLTGFILGFRFWFCFQATIPATPVARMFNLILGNGALHSRNDSGQTAIEQFNIESRNKITL